MAMPLVCAIGVFATLYELRERYVPFERSALPPLHFVHYRLPYAHVDLYWVWLAATLWAGALLLTLVLLRRARQLRNLRVIIALQALLLLTFVFAPMPLDSDQYAYVGYGSAVLHGESPYAPKTLPRSATVNQLRVAVIWGNPIFRDRYGPLWTLANAAFLAPLRGTSVEFQVIWLRFLAALAAIGCTLLIWTGITDSHMRAVAAAAFALNPLPVIEIGGGAHNDVLMVLCCLGAVYALQRRHPATAALLLGASIAIKFAYVPLVLPLLAYVYVHWRRISLLFLTLVLAAAPTLICALAFGLRTSLLAEVAFAQSHGNVIAHLPLLDRLPHDAVYLAVVTLLATAVLVATWRVLKRQAAYAELATALVLTWLFADKIESWYALLLTPLVLVPGDTGIALFFGITCASLAMLSGSFLNFYPAAATIALAILLWMLCYAAFTKAGRSDLLDDPSAGFAEADSQIA
jgi:hypothetical protein